MNGDVFLGVRVQGGLVPADLLSQLATGKDIRHLDAVDYHLGGRETVTEAASRVWSYLRGVWSAYREQLATLPESDRATTLTRERWLLIVLDQLGYGRVPTTPAGGLEAQGQAFAVSHVWNNVPIHLLGAAIALDHRTPGVPGAAGRPPQSMVQELLNCTDAYLWAILSNGRALRLLRDSTSLVGQAYVEFDLEAIFDGEVFASFDLLYKMCHVSRLEVRDRDAGPASCRLEGWRTGAIEAGSRALNQLRDGVVGAIRLLGGGFLSHPGNAGLRELIATGELSLADVNHALLRVVYRLLFMFVAEDRDVLLDPAAPVQARQRYAEYFSTSRLRRVARRRLGGRHGDRWQALSLVWRGLGSDGGLPELGIGGIGGLFEPGPLDLLLDCQLSNEALLGAVRALSLMREPRTGVRRVVDYRNLGAEELGSIYESLLEYVPHWDPAARRYTLDPAPGNQRKTTGSYYTPTALIERLLDSALDPVLDDAEKNAADDAAREAALLAVTVCDPACGSGHFLVAAARRIAKRVAAARSGDPEPPPEQVRDALRDVVARCVYGVDVNPLAAELAKVSLWLEALQPGLPMAFLDAHIKVGNALLGSTPALLAGGLPDAAFDPIEGDDKRVATLLKKQNKAERLGQGSLFDVGAVLIDNRALARAAAQISTPSRSIADVHVAQQRLRAYIDSAEYRRRKLAADAWCAAFVWPKTRDAPPPPTTQVILDLLSEADSPAGARDVGRRIVLPAAAQSEVGRLTAEYRFFHWHLEFPQVFPTVGADAEVNPGTGWAGGFDVVLGNPPWDKVEFKEQEFFASRDVDIANAAGVRRKQLIKTLEQSNATLHAEYLRSVRHLEGEAQLVKASERYPLTGRGRINTYALFAEGDRDLLAPSGRLGVILPTGIATDATTQYFFRDLVETGALASLYDFENRKPLFDGVDSRFKFCLLTVAGRGLRESAAEFAFFCHNPADLDRPSRCFELTPDEIALLNPNTRTCPVFRSRRDAEITLDIYRRVPVLIDESDPVRGNPWGIKFMQGLFNMTSDSHLFHTREELEADGWTLVGNIFERTLAQPAEEAGGGG